MVPVSKLSAAPVPGGALPFSVNGLYLSKFVMRSGGTSSISPPLGAFGVHPLEMREARWILDVAELRVGMRGRAMPGDQRQQDQPVDSHQSMVGTFLNGAARRGWGRLGGGGGHLVDGSALDDPAQVHHRHLVREILDDRDVVRDEEVGEPSRSCSARSRFRICACTETSSALVGSSHTISLRLDRERARDGDALALPAGELVRIALLHLGRQADLVQERRVHPSSAIASQPTPSAACPSRRISATRIRGLSEPYGSWKMICIAPRRGAAARGGRVRSAFETGTLPPVGT